MKNNYDAVSLLNDIIVSRLTDFCFENTDVIFSEHVPCGQACISTSGDIDTLHEIYDINIGIGDINRSNIDYYQLMLLFKSTFHELAHVKQEFRHLYETSDEMLSMGLVYISCLLYFSYYKEPYNYFHNLKEVDAEYNGLLDAYNLMQSLFGNYISDKCLLTFIRHHVDRYRLSHKSYYIDMSHYYDNVFDIFDAFKVSKNVACHSYRYCDFWIGTEFDAVVHESDGFTQDKMLLLNFLDKHPEYKNILKQNTISFKLLDI